MECWLWCELIDERYQLAHREDFIYEYIGEVISESTFRKRIKDYADQGIQHFYFMMLQKEEVRSTASPLLLAVMLPIRTDLLTTMSLAVHRCDEAGREGAIPESLLQSELLRSEMGGGETNADGNFRETRHPSRRGTYL